MPDSLRLCQNQVNPTWSMKRFLPDHFLRYLKFFTILFIKYPLSFLTIYETFYIGPAQWLVTFPVSPKSSLSPCHTIPDSMKNKKHFLPFWECELICFPDALLQCLWMSFIYHLKTVYQQDDKVKKFSNSACSTYMQFHENTYWISFFVIIMKLTVIDHEWRLDYVSCNSTSHFE